MDRIKVFVANEDPEERASIVDILSNVEYITLSGEAETANETLVALEGDGPDVIIIGAYLPGDGYKLTEKVAKEYPEKAIIIVERELKEESMRKAIFAGAKDLLIYPFTPSKLVDSIYRSYQLEQKKQVLQKDSQPRGKRRARKGQVIPVFSTKGGVGRTFIAANLAVTLAQQAEASVVLVDLDLDFGNSALALNIIPRYTIADVINDIRNLDQDLMESYLIPHRSGIKVLPANAQPQLTEFVSAEHVEIILNVLKSAYDYVVVDMPARFSGPVDPAFQMADILFLVTTPEVATVRNIKASLLTLDNLNYPKSKIKVLLNKADSGNEIKAKDVESTLNASLFASLPLEQKLATSSLNKGIPVVLLYPRAKISRAFNDLSRKLSDADGGGKKA